MNMAGSESIWPILLLFVATLLMAVISFRYARGNGVSIPAQCRKCGYDVSQRPIDSARCSECGSDLNARGAVVTIAIKRLWISLIVGLAVSVVLLGMSIESVRSFNWPRWYLTNSPTWLIVYHARHSARPERFRSEWSNRHVRVDELIDLLLDEYAANPRGWSGYSQTILDDVILQSSDAQLTRYLELAIANYDVALSPKVREGEKVLWGIKSRVPISKYMNEPTLDIEVDHGPLRKMMITHTKAQEEEQPEFLLGVTFVEQRTYSLRFYLQLSLQRREVTSQRRKFESSLQVLPEYFADGEKVDLTPAQLATYADRLLIDLQNDGINAVLTILSLRTQTPLPLSFSVDIKGRTGVRSLGLLREDLRHPEYRFPIGELNEDGSITVILRGDPRGLDVRRGESQYWAGRIVFSRIGATSRGSSLQWPYRIEMPATPPVR